MAQKFQSLLAPALACLALAACGKSAAQPSTPDDSQTEFASITLTSQSFPADGAIPTQYACTRYGGSDLSPQLSWTTPPLGAKSLVLTTIDTDARGFVHWLVYNLPAETFSLAEGQVPPEAAQGKNSFGKQAYGGPCPPSGTHQYVFTLYALDNIPDLQPGASLDQVNAAMKGHLLAQGSLTGTFRAPK